MANKKIKIKSHRHSLSLVILGVVALGAIITLVASFADTTDYTAPTNFTATPTNTSAYQVKMSWVAGYGLSGAKFNPDGFVVAWTSDNSTYYHYYTTNGYTIGKTYTYTAPTGATLADNSGPAPAIKCGINYKYEVRAERKASASPTGHYGESPYAITNATAACPTANFSSVTTSGATGLAFAWTTNFGTSFKLTLKTASNPNFSAVYSGSTKSYTNTQLACGTTYTASLYASAGGQSGATSTTSHSTSACPAPPSTGGGGGGTTSGGGGSTSGSGSSSGGSTHHSGGSGGSSSSGIPQPPAAPTGFTATVQSDKIVELDWNPSSATAGIANYVLNRSIDNVVWTPLATVTDTAYEDTSTDFNSTYYYQVEAVDNAGNVSPYSTTQVTTGTFSSTSNKITSDDKLVTITIPDGAFSGDTDCTISSGDSSNISSGTKSKTVLLLGPYSMLCVDSTGTVIDAFNKPVNVTMNLAQASAGFGNFSVKTINGSKTSAVKSSYDTKKKTISFQLTAAVTFGAYGVRHKSAGGLIWSIFLILLFGGLLVVGFRFLRRRTLAAHDPSIPSSAAVEQQFEAAVNKPNCTHLSMAHQVQPQSEGCQECIAAGRKWKDLRICLTCGHVGCSDDSEGQDARKHFEETGHPLIMAYNNPAVGNIGWCYIDQTYI